MEVRARSSRGSGAFFNARVKVLEKDTWMGGGASQGTRGIEVSRGKWTPVKAVRGSSKAKNQGSVEVAMARQRTKIRIARFFGGVRRGHRALGDREVSGNGGMGKGRGGERQRKGRSRRGQALPGMAEQRAR